MIFLGVLDRAQCDLPQSDQLALQAAITRSSQDHVTVHHLPHFSLLVVQDPAYRDALCVQTSAEHLGLVSGRPYLDETDASRDAATLLQALRAGDRETLRHSRGSFCALAYDALQGTLYLCSDKVGVYPIYIARVGSRVYFASALRMLRALPGVCEETCIDGLFTQVAFGFPLGRRTAYAQVERMYGGELARFGLQTEPVVERYWHWDQVPAAPAPVPLDELAQRIHELFLDAVRIRTAGSTGDLSFLSGGLDSRCIVAALREIQRRVWSLNFAPEGAQDHLFGRLVAQRLGAQHFELGLNSGSFPQRQREILDAWAASHTDEVAAGVKPLRVWSGDGGSVGLGHVYLDETFVERLRNSTIADACEYFIRQRKHVVPLGMLHRHLHASAQQVPQQAMCAEIASFHTADPAKAGLLFLLLNDQRQHLTEYFENLDLYRFELVLPFFDAHLLEAVVAAPLDVFLRHGFYNRWLQEFPPGVAEVPWQAYPGHAPCPVPADDYGPLRYQWKEDWFDPVETERRFRRALEGWDRAIAAEAFPSRLLSRPKLRLAWWLTRLKLRDYSYLLDAARRVTEVRSC